MDDVTFKLEFEGDVPPDQGPIPAPVNGPAPPPLPPGTPPADTTTSGPKKDDDGGLKSIFDLAAQLAGSAGFGALYTQTKKVVEGFTLLSKKLDEQIIDAEKVEAPIDRLPDTSLAGALRGPTPEESWERFLQGLQFQQDMNKYAIDYTVWIYKARVWMW